MGYYKRQIITEMDRFSEEEVLQGHCTPEEEEEYARLLRNTRLLEKQRLVERALEDTGLNAGEFAGLVEELLEDTNDAENPELMSLEMVR